VSGLPIDGLCVDCPSADSGAMLSTIEVGYANESGPTHGSVPSEVIHAREMSSA
jgi:hypothetical protein